MRYVFLFKLLYLRNTTKEIDQYCGCVGRVVNLRLLNTKQELYLLNSGAGNCDGTKSTLSLSLNLSIHIKADPVSTGNTFQDLPPLLETADNTESYI